MRSNGTGKEMMDAAMKARRELGSMLNVGSSLMMEKIERIAHELEAEKLGVFASSHEPGGS